MTERRPLVVIDGIATVLPPEDSLPGGGATSNINNVTYQWDFLNSTINADIWLGQAISSGTNNGTTASIVDENHPGVVRLNSTTTTNSGYRYTSGVATTSIMQIKAGVKFNFIGRIIGESDSRINLGFMNNNAAGSPASGALFQISGLSLGAACLSGGASTEATLASLSASEWYNFEIVVNSSSSVTFTVFNSDGTVFATTTITSNVPSSVLGNGIVAWTVGVANINLIYADLIRLSIPNLQRG